MEVYQQSLGVDIWDSVENGYEVPKTTPMDAADKRQYKNTARARNAKLCDLTDYEFTKVI